MVDLVKVVGVVAEKYNYESPRKGTILKESILILCMKLKKMVVDIERTSLQLK